MKKSEKRQGKMGKPENRRNNRLTPAMEAAKFKPGQSGNPGGRPKNTAVTEAYKTQLAEIDPNDPKGRTYAEVIASMQIKRAAKGDTAAAREITDRTEGKAAQSVCMAVSGEQTVAAPILQIQFVEAEDGKRAK